MDEVIEEASKKYQGLVPLVYDIETMGLDEARPQDMPYAVYLKREADKVIAEKDKEIADLIEKNKRLANKDMIMASETIKGICDELRLDKYKQLAARWGAGNEIYEVPCAGLADRIERSDLGAHDVVNLLEDLVGDRLEDVVRQVAMVRFWYDSARNAK